MDEVMAKIKVEIRCGDRYIGEYLDIAKIKDEFDKVTQPFNFDWYIRPITITVDELGKLNGDHFIYVYMEEWMKWIGSDFNPLAYLTSRSHWIVTVLGVHHENQS
jgi:hypothetical protein